MRILDFFNKFVMDPRSITHHALNWHQQEVGGRHPVLPLGWVLRDQGQTDIFAGKSKLIMQINGDTLQLATRYALSARRISIVSEDISCLSILGKVFTKKIFNGTPVAIPKVPVEALSTSCFVLSSAGAPVPITTFFDFTPVFEPSPEPPTADEEIWTCTNKAFKGQIFGCF